MVVQSFFFSGIYIFTFIRKCPHAFWGQCGYVNSESEALNCLQLHQRLVLCYFRGRDVSDISAGFSPARCHWSVFLMLLVYKSTTFPYIKCGFRKATEARGAGEREENGGERVPKRSCVPHKQQEESREAKRRGKDEPGKADVPVSCLLWTVFPPCGNTVNCNCRRAWSRNRERERVEGGVWVKRDRERGSVREGARKERERERVRMEREREKEREREREREREKREREFKLRAMFWDELIC